MLKTKVASKVAIFRCWVRGALWCLTGLLCLTESQAQSETPDDFRYFYGKGQEACQEKEYSECLEYFSKSNQLRPGHQIIMYQLARAFAYNHLKDSAVHYLSKALAIRADFELTDSAFIGWQQTPEFIKLRALKENLLAPVHHSTTVSVLKQRDLHLESLAFDPQTNRLFAGSVRARKILWSHPGDSIWHNFAEKEHGLGSVFGMKVDPKRRHLWVCSVSTPYMMDADSNTNETSAVYKYHLDSKQLLQSYPLNDTLPHWFGDLTLTQQGDVYISDSRANAIYRITAEKDSLELFLKSQQFLSLQGLDFDPTDHYLFVSDYVRGPFKIDLNQGTISKIQCSLPNISLKSIDGLYYFQNSLITTQNQVYPMRVTRYYLDDHGSKVVSVKFLEKANPLLNEPTLGVIHQGAFFYVANSQWGGYDQQNNPLPVEQLQDIHIMKVGL